MELEFVIPLDFLPSTMPGNGPDRPGKTRRRMRMLGACLAVVFLLATFWDYAYQGYYWFVVYVLVFTGHPVGAFGAIAAAIFGLGWYWRWPPILVNRHPAWRASLLVACAFVVHAGWFLSGWVTFRPLCVDDTAVRMAAMYDISEALFDSPARALNGSLRPNIADDFEASLSRKWGSNTVRRADEHTLLVRPVIGLLDNTENWQSSSRLIDGPLPDGSGDDQCGEMAIHGFVPGKPIRQRVGWGLWPWNSLNENGVVARWLRGLYVDR